MFRMIKGNVERIAETEFQRNQLLNLGYADMYIDNTEISDNSKNNDIILEEMTVERLKAIAKENNISSYGGMNKAALIESIRKLGQE